MVENQKDEQTVFDQISQENDVETSVEEKTPSSQGEEFSLEELSDAGKKYERVDLNGQIVTIKTVKILKPTEKTEVRDSLKGTHKMKNCQFTIFYDTPNDDHEHISGVKMLCEIGKDNWSSPNIHKTAQNQAAKLFRKAAEFKKIDPEEYSMREFIAFLMTKPKVKIVAEDINWDGKKYRKNMVEQFVA